MKYTMLLLLSAFSVGADDTSAYAACVATQNMPREPLADWVERKVDELLLSPYIPLVLLDKTYNENSIPHFELVRTPNKDCQTFYIVRMRDGRVSVDVHQIISQAELHEQDRAYLDENTSVAWVRVISKPALDLLRKTYREERVFMRACSTLPDHPVIQEVSSRIEGETYLFPVNKDKPISSEPLVGRFASNVVRYLKTLQSPKAPEIDTFKASRKTPNATTNIWIKRKDLAAIIAAFKALDVPEGAIVCEQNACYVGSKKASE